MMKPDDITQSDWDAAEVWFEKYLAMNGEGKPAIQTIARAIMYERDRCAAAVDKMVTDICEEHGDYEPDTNVTNLPEWAESVCEELEKASAAIKARGK